MGLFTDYLYEKLPFSDITLEDIETVAKIQFPKYKIFIENDKLFIESNEFLGSRRNGFDTDGEITLNKDGICFKTKVNVTTFIVYGFLFAMIVGVSFYMMIEDKEHAMSNVSSIVWLQDFAMVPISLVGFLVGIGFALHRTTAFLAENLIAALKIYKMK